MDSPVGEKMIRGLPWGALFGDRRIGEFFSLGHKVHCVKLNRYNKEVSCLYRWSTEIAFLKLYPESVDLLVQPESQHVVQLLSQFLAVPVQVWLAFPKYVHVWESRLAVCHELKV